MTSEVIGSGKGKVARELGQKYVYVEQHDPELTAGQAESYYHLTRIASLLFPDVIPQVGAASFDKTTQKAGFIVEKVAHDPLHARHQAYLSAKAAGNDDVSEWSKINEEFKKRALEPEYQTITGEILAAGFTGYEVEPHNVSRDSDGKLKFFDLEPAWHQWKPGEVWKYKLNFAPNTLLAAIDKLPTDEKKLAIDAYKRIRDLAPTELKDQLPAV